MYKPRDHYEAAPGGAPAAAVALAPVQLLIVAPVSHVSSHPIVRILLRWRDRLEVRLAAADLAPDLAEGIGSARWFRGLGTLAALCLLAWLVTPGFAAVQATPTMRLDAAQRDEFRSQMITPLALGADSGRHMGASGAVVPLAEAPVDRPIVQLVATFGQGDTFNAMLLRAGVTPYDAARASEMVMRLVPQDQLAPGTQVDLTLGQSQGATGVRPLDKLSFRARFDLDLVVQRNNGVLGIASHSIQVDSTPLRIRGIVGSSIYRSARAAGAPIEAIQQYLQAIDQHLSLDTDIAPGDTFDIIVAYRRSAEGETRVGDLLYAGLERGGRPEAQLLRWGSDGQFFEASGMGAQRTGLIMPVFGHVTSGFGLRRHPILGYTRMHAGIDFGAPWGSPIYAVGDATVSYAGWHGGHGNYVRLEHGSGFATGYGHMSRIAVSPGMHVRAGQVIGYVGSTGLSTGPHLHYELYRNGETVNPMSVAFTVSNQVDAKELAAFKAKLAALKAVKPGVTLTGLASHPNAAVSGAPQREIDRIS